MKKKKFYLLSIVLITGLFLVSCNKLNGKEDDSSAYEKIHNMLLKLETYEAIGKVKYISNKNDNEYTTKQQGKITGEYRIEIVGPEDVAGTITIFNGEEITQYNPKLSNKVVVSVKENQERSEIFLTSFIKNYFTSKEVSVSVSGFGGSKYTVLEAIIPGGHPFLASEKLWVDNETWQPYKLEIYDKDGGERIVVTYEEFLYNTIIEDEIFKIE